MDMKLMIEMYRAFHAGAPLGDVALMKFAALRNPPAEINEKLRDVAGYAPGLELNTLLAMPDGSLGQTYGRFLRDNHIEHLDISPDVLARFGDNPYAVRYTVTHDLHHVLCGFDTGLAGEYGVVGFTVTQGIAPMSKLALSFASHAVGLISPSQASATRHNYKLGMRMGERAELVLAAPLESWLEQPIDEVRRRLGIDAADVADVQPSGHSWFVDKLYGRRNDLAPAAAE